jgi:serine O-acetyltransferase
MFDTLRADLDAYLQRDPAARNKMEVFFLYSGYKAVRKYRRAHWFQIHNMKFIARWLSQRARNKTGVEIHPGATIGKGLVIDHGMGVVIGETTVIGDNCLIYQNVTLGGTGKDQGKRHPTLGDNVMVGSGAKVLGPFKVGDNSRVAANSVVLSEIPPNSTAVGVPARIIRIDGKKVNYVGDVDQVSVTDPVGMELAALRRELDDLLALHEEENRNIL